MSLQRRKPSTPARPDRSAEFASFKLKPTAAVVGATTRRTPIAVTPKVQGRVRLSIRESANGEACLMQLPGCPRDNAMTIWSHNRHMRAGKAKSMKAPDVNGCYACTYCDAIYDGQRDPPDGMLRSDVELCWYMAHDVSLLKLHHKGLV